MSTKIVLGTCFGDEGKGQTVSSLCRSKQELVIRFNGGHQAGHTVILGNKKHVFSTFGSGTLNGNATFYSKYCTFYPLAFLNELNKLNEIGIEPTFYIDPLCPVTTSMDVYYNQLLSKRNGHGSVGVGFGTTIQRHEETPYKLYVNDLKYKEIYEQKLHAIHRYYIQKIREQDLTAYLYNYDPFNLSRDIKSIQGIRNKYIVCQLSQIKSAFSDFIFEGAQGIMLDMDHGFFPNVTRSNTTCKNAVEIIKENNLKPPIDTYYVMRSYLTRHGNGYMSNEDNDIELKNTDNEINVENEYQGKFRKGYHSIQLLKHAISCNRIYSMNRNERLNITCLDQTDCMILIDNKKITIKEFSSLLKNEKFGIEGIFDLSLYK